MFDKVVFNLCFHLLGEGAFGKVVKAEYYPRLEDRDAKAGKIVAVKMLRGNIFCLISC